MNEKELPNSRLGLYVISGLVVALPLILAIELLFVGVLGWAWQFCARMWGG